MSADVLTGAGSPLGALILAFARPVLAAAAAATPRLRAGRRLDRALQRFQSGVVNDYVTWIVLGLACVGGVLALIIR